VSMFDDEGYTTSPSQVAANSSRRRAGIVDRSLEKSPISNASRSIQMDNFAPTGLDSGLKIRGQRTEARFSDSLEKDGLLAGADARQTSVEETSDEQLWDGVEDKRIERLLSRLMAVQGGINVHPHFSSPENVLLAKSHHADNNLFSLPPESSRAQTRDIPVRFHPGRESLSVQRNITVRGSKRSKERSQDREYKQRYSISPGKLAGDFGVGLSHDDHAHRHSSDDHDTGDNTNSSRGDYSSSIRATDRRSIHTPSSVPSPRDGTQSRPSPRDGAQSRDGGNPDFTNPYFITLIFYGH
jgi:hypothetical protein